MFHGMKIYTAHIKPGTPGAGERPVLLREGFNYYAFFFTWIWALYQRLWLQVVLILAFQFLVAMLMKAQTFTPASCVLMQFAFQLLVAWQANDWVRTRLTRRGYIMADVAAAESRLRAEQHYFERHLAST